jgi:hypothetical protein
MFRTIFEVTQQQRLAWSCAILVGMFLALFGHAPVLPVIVGCILAVGIAVLRAWPTAVARAKK